MGGLSQASLPLPVVIWSQEHPGASPEPGLGTPVLSAHRALSVGCWSVYACSPPSPPQSRPPRVSASPSDASVSLLWQTFLTHPSPDTVSSLPGGQAARQRSRHFKYMKSSPQPCELNTTALPRCLQLPLHRAAQPPAPLGAPPRARAQPPVALLLPFLLPRPSPAPTSCP